MAQLVTNLAYWPLDGTLRIHFAGHTQGSMAEGVFRRIEIYYDLQDYAHGLYRPVAIRLNLERLDEDLLWEVRCANLPRVDYPAAALLDAPVETLLIWAYGEFISGRSGCARTGPNCL